MIGDNVEVKVLDAKVLSKNYGTIKFGVDAPTEIPVHRKEIYKKIRDEQGS